MPPHSAPPIATRRARQTRRAARATAPSGLLLAVPGLVVLLALLALPLPLAAQPAQVTLRALVEPGVELRWEMLTSQRTTADGEPEALSETRQLVHETVRLDEEGDRPIVRQVIESIRFLDWSREGGERSYDSELDPLPSDPALQSIARLAGTINEVPAPLPADPRTVRFGPRLPGLLPEGPVEVGSSWDDVAGAQPGPVRARMTTSYRLVALEEEDGRTLARIEGTMAMASGQGRPVPDFSPHGETTPEPWRLEVLFDVERGIVLELVRTLVETFEAEGREFRVTMEQIERVR